MHLLYKINLIRNNEAENAEGFVKKLHFRVDWTFSDKMKRKMQKALKKIEIFCMQNNE